MARWAGSPERRGARIPCPRTEHASVPGYVFGSAIVCGPQRRYRRAGTIGPRAGLPQGERVSDKRPETTPVGAAPSLRFFTACSRGGSPAVAAVAFWDDHGHVSRRLRVAVHFGAAAWAPAWVGGLPPLPLGGGAVGLGFAGDALAAVAVVWLLNLYNFMDGIDGIAGVEAVTVAGGAALILLLGGDPASAHWVLWLAAAAAGFLVWNWPPARIFMGDAGSGFLGFVFGALAVATSHGEAINLWSWAILLAAFIGDATWTLLRRLTRRDTWYEAHRSHAYQIASRRLGSHLKVTLLVGAFNLLWLLPLALLAATRPEWGWALALLAYLPVVAVAAGLGAGRAEVGETATGASQGTGA